MPVYFVNFSALETYLLRIKRDKHNSLLPMIFSPLIILATTEGTKLTRCVPFCLKVVLVAQVFWFNNWKKNILNRKLWYSHADVNQYWCYGFESRKTSISKTSSDIINHQSNIINQSPVVPVPAISRQQKHKKSKLGILKRNGLN